MAFERGDHNRSTLNSRQNRLRTALRALILRERWGLSLWKREEQYKRFNGLPETKLGELLTKPNCEDKEEKFGSLGNWFADYAVVEPKGRAFLDSVENNLNGEEGDWYLLEATDGFSVKGGDYVITPSPGKSRAMHLESGSTVAGAVKEAWRKDIHFFVFRITSDKTWDDKTEKQEKAREEGCEKVAQHIVAQYNGDTSCRSSLDDFQPPS